MPAVPHALPQTVSRDAIAFALRYPFAIPPHSYLYLDGAGLPLEFPAGGGLAHARVRVGGASPSLAEFAHARGMDAEALFGKRSAVLSFGSNAAPEQLARKFSGLPGPVLIPVLRAELAGFDAVYSAHIARYGSVPAALAAAPGCAVQVFVNFLDDEQLRLMHRSEGVGRSYAFSRLEDIDLRLDGGGALDRVCFYRSCAGVLVRDGLPIALAAIPARRRRFPALDQRGVLDWVRGRLAPELDLESFIAGNIAAPEWRAANIRSLSASAAPAGFTSVDCPT